MYFLFSLNLHRLVSLIEPFVLFPSFLHSQNKTTDYILFPYLSIAHIKRPSTVSMITVDRTIKNITTYVHRHKQ